MKGSKCFAAFSFAFFLLSAGVNPGNAGQGKDDLPSLVEKALQTNPELLAAQSRWQAYADKTVSARSLDDPVAGIALSNYPVDTFNDNQTPMTGKVIKLSQKFPFPGKLAAKGEVAEQQALWYRSLYEDSRLQVARSVKEAYYQLQYLDSALEITARNLEILDGFTRLTETRYETGKGLQQDVLKAQLERTRILDRRLTLQQQRESVLAGFNKLLNRSSTEEIEPEPADQQVSPLPDVATLEEQSRQHRPLYAAYQSLIDRYKGEQRLAELDYRPDFTVGAAYTVRERTMADPGTDFFSAEISLNLPLYRAKRKSAVASAESSLRMAFEQYNDFRNTLAYNIQDASSQAERARQQVLLYQGGLIPLGQQSYASTLAAYQVGKVDFLSLLNNLLSLYQLELDHQRAIQDFWRNRARLEAETGLSFDDRTLTEAQPSNSEKQSD